MCVLEVLIYTFLLIPSSEDCSPFREGGCCYARSLSWLMIVPIMDVCVCVGGGGG